MSNFPISLTGDPLPQLPDSQQPKVTARFVPVDVLKAGDIVWRSGGWRRVHNAGAAKHVDDVYVRPLIIGSEVVSLPVHHRLCRKVHHEITQPA